MLFDSDEKIMAEFYHGTVEAGAHVILWTYPDGRVTRSNHAACKFLGYSDEELAVMNIGDILAEFNENEWKEFSVDLKKTRIRLFETEMVTKDGTVVPVEIDAGYLEIKNEEFICLFVHDVIDRREVERLLKKSESNLLEAQKLAHIGSWEWDILNNELS